MRDIKVVISQMVRAIPKEYSSFINRLLEIQNMTPENTYYPLDALDEQKWDSVSYVLQVFIPRPEKDWEYYVLSVWTTKSVPSLKRIFKNKKQ